MTSHWAKFCVRSCFLENTHCEPIDRDRFDLIKHSRTVLSAAFETEDIFDNLISNYIEVESRCLELTASQLVRRPVGYREGNERMAAINLVFVNYLSTARSYVDKIGSASSRCFEGSETKTAGEHTKTWLAEQFDGSFGFRFLEALRNHVQHNGSALHVLGPGYRRSVTSTEVFLEPMCSKARLIERGGFKAQVLKECPEEINLIECARLHVHGLSRVQRRVRDLTAQAISDAVGNLKQGQALLDGKVSGSLDATEAVALDQEGAVTEAVPMLLHWEDVRTWLVQRNPGVTDGVRTFPSGRADLSRCA